MIISHKYKFLFIHLPKTGGTSIEKQFSTMDGVLSLSCPFGRTPSAEGPRGRLADGLHFGLKHAKAHELQQLLGPEIWDTYYKFAIVRNPFSKTLSSYYHFEKMADPNSEFKEGWAVDLRKNKPFKNINEFLLYEGGRGAWPYVTQPMCGYLWADNKIDPSIEIFRFEEGLDLIIRQVSERINKLRSSFPIITKVTERIFTTFSKQLSYRDILNETSRKAIEQINRDDFEQFFYEW